MLHRVRAGRSARADDARRLALPLLLSFLAIGFLVAAPLALARTATGAKRGAGASASTARVLHIGIDAADWTMIRPLVEQGRMPNLAKLLAHGASGDLLTIQPMTKSPVIWATIATGKTPAKHGISDFLAGGIPVTSNGWRAKPLWDILGSAGRSVCVVGWYTTWPAPPVNGVLVSNYVPYMRGAKGHKLEHLTYPVAEAKRLEKLSIDPAAVTYGDIRRFLGADPDSIKLTTEAVNVLEEFKWIYAADVTLARMATALYREKRPDYFTVYLRGVDEMSHHFWNYQKLAPVPMGEPRTPAEAQFTTLFRDVVPLYYAFTDSLIGELVRSADEKTTIVINSDHGFAGGRNQGGVAAHRPEGVIIVAGRGAAYVQLSGATVYDVAPTLLAMFGLPRATDMDGVVLTEALVPSVFPPVRGTLASYGSPQYAGKGPAGQKAIPSPVDEELKERLKSLGYINK